MRHGKVCNDWISAEPACCLSVGTCKTQRVCLFRAGAIIILLTVGLCSGEHVLASERERSVCGGFMEPLAFALWSAMVPKPDQRLLAGIVGVKPYEFVAGDGKTLRGYLIQARKDQGEIIENPRGYVLIAPGNAMTATHLVADFVFLSALGYDVYILDYRGYGNSEGKRRLLAMTVDYEELIEHLSAKYPHTYLLGLSLGGIVILKAIHEGARFTRAIIDSSPSTVTQFVCPQVFNPVENLPQDASSMLIITGGRDRVIPPEASEELVSKARASGAQVFRCDECGHPLMDADPDLRARRFREIARFFAERDDNASTPSR